MTRREECCGVGCQAEALYLVVVPEHQAEFIHLAPVWCAVHAQATLQSRARWDSTRPRQTRYGIWDCAAGQWLVQPTEAKGEV